MTGIGQAFRFVGMRVATALIAVGLVAGARALGALDGPRARFLAPLSSLGSSAERSDVPPGDIRLGN